MPEPSEFHDSRPSGIISGKSSGFNVGKFLGLTVALAAGAGAGVGGYALLRARASNADAPPVDAPADVAEDEEAADAASPREDLPPPKREPDLPSHDDGKIRLDLPDHPSNRPGGGGGGGGDPSGPDVEVADW